MQASCALPATLTAKEGRGLRPCMEASPAALLPPKEDKKVEKGVCKDKGV